METIKLNARNREIGLVTPEKLRKAGEIPAVLYGHGVANIHVAVNKIEFEKVLRKAGESTLVEIVTEDGNNHNVLIQDVQKHFLTSQPIHVDFYEVSMTEKLTATVALEFIGESPAVKTQSGVLVKVLNEVEVECLPVDLPHNIEVDISALKTFDDVITVADLSVSEKVAILTPQEELVVKIQPPRDVEAELAAPIEMDISQVEGIEKKEEPAEGEVPTEE